MSGDPEKQTMDPPEGPSSSSSSPTKSRVGLLVVLGVVILAVIATVVGVTVGNRNDNNNNSLEGSEDSQDTASNGFTTSERTTFQSQVGPLEVLPVPVFDPNSSANIAVYENKEDAQLAFEQLGKWVLNNAIQRNSGNPLFANTAFGFQSFRGIDVGIAIPEMAAGQGDVLADNDSSSGAAAPLPTVGNDANSFETNSQEENADEADFSKSDGTFLYTAYGNKLLILRTAVKELVVELEMPPVKQNDNGYGGGGVADPSLPVRRRATNLSVMCRPTRRTPIQRRPQGPHLSGTNHHMPILKHYS